MCKIMCRLFFIVLVLLNTCCLSHGQSMISRWKFKTDGPIRSAPCIDGDNIYLANSAGTVYCLKKGVGTYQWEYMTGSAINSTPVTSQSHVFVINRKEEVLAIQKHTGKLEWSRKLENTLPSPIGGWKVFTAGPVVEGEVVYVPSGDGHLYALEVATGKEIWKYRVGWRIRASPLIQHDVIYQPANDGKLHVIDKKTGSVLWQFETDGAKPNPDDPFADVKRGNYDSPTIKDGILVFGSRDGKTYAVDIETRREKWRWTYGSTWAMANTIDDQTVFVGWSTNNLVCALDLQTGQEKWNHQNGSHVYTKPLIYQDRLFYGCADGYLYCLDKETGEEIFKYSVGEEIFSSPVLDQDIIYFGSDDGYLYALEEGVPGLLKVYMPDSLTEMTSLVANPQIVPFLLEKGFSQLNDRELISFIQERVDDGVSSVIVFALPIIPDTLIGGNPTAGLFRKYLEKGGKVVWTGTVPNFFALGDNGFFRRDVETGCKLLDITFTNPQEGGNYYCRPTRLGLNMGIPTWSKSTGAVVKMDDDITPLAIDEFDRVTGWMKSFHKRPGSGFISHRSWAWNVGMDENDLQIIYDLAVYGLK